MLVNQKMEGVIVPLNDELKVDGKLELANSSYFEMAGLGFEYGASWERPNLLLIREAQFCDFFNSAQVILLCNSFVKWLRQSGIIVMLPHGLDGAGPEHSSSWIERMLQLTNDHYNVNSEPTNINMHAAFPTMPAQYFHLLRRQICQNYRKPLVIAAPKGLLWLSAASSTMADIESGTHFKPVLADPLTDKVKATRVVMLSGKIYYELIKERQARGLDDTVTFIRIEELAPFPFQQLEEVLQQYLCVEEFAWLQEELRNQGTFTHVSGWIGSVLRKMGRGEKEVVIQCQ
ncbi:Transketolase, pyrimidine binding domain-containing protein [Gymnopilus junonius]|uniref:Transketolase, pyrimidine binding domain-containing protein n=1 Tax=Gymnopilus junonius TaxID=109634 RepID=A0A9P5NB89_GYMJU|nr:Transketolase, pyrimidine binding domain-containing protein [Gymnopilus junonius]